jgi:hypothetical protein
MQPVNSNQQSPISNLPSNFQFSQGSLQAYVDCPRLFQLRYIEQLAWPAPEVEPALENELLILLGSDFHRLVQQYLLGVPPERLAKLAERDEKLSQWWQHFQDDGPSLFSYTHYQEITLSSAIDEHRLVAKYDLITISPSLLQQSSGQAPTPLPEEEGKITIYDWKTSQKLPKREWQEKKLQTRVYPYLLVKAGALLNGGQPIKPGQIEMIYWFSNFPTAPMKFPYNQGQFEADEQYLTGLIEEIKGHVESEAPKTENEKRCPFCVYRSLCNRGVKAGSLDELEDEIDIQDGFDFELNFEQIAEIEF